MATFTTLETMCDYLNNTSEDEAVAAGLDTTSLPVFGGEAPDEQAVRSSGYQAMWSWDAGRVLVSEKNGRFVVVDRQDIVTDDRIAALRDEAGAAGDAEMAAICTQALDGDDDARAECARVIGDAEAMRDRTDYGRLCDYRTGEPIRRATAAERDASLDAAERDGGRGVFEAGGRLVYVED